MRVRYIGQDDRTETFGRTFTRGRWMDCSALDDHARETLAQNPQFEVEPAIDATAVEAAPADGAAETPALEA